MTTDSQSDEKDQFVLRCLHVSPTPWGPSRCALPDGHEGRHAYDPAEERSDVTEYVAAMTDAELAQMLDADVRRASGRCVSPPILRAAREEVARRG